MPRVFVSWSGGKDGCLAAYRALSRGFEVKCLANTVTADGQRSCSHGIAASVIKKQAAALGIPIAQRRTTGENYESEFIKMLRGFKEDAGIEGGVFGDIDFEPHREWIERVCREAGVTPYLLLWQEDQTKLLEEFIDLGFRTIVVAARAEFLGDEVLGRTVDREFLAYLKAPARAKPITPCGEAGEYHTLVIDGPIFKKRLEVLKTRQTTRDGIHYLETLETALKDK